MKARVYQCTQKIKIIKVIKFKASCDGAGLLVSSPIFVLASIHILFSFEVRKVK